MSKKKKSQNKMRVDHNRDVFYSNGFSVNKNENGNLIIDFRQSLPRTDVTPDKNVINTMSVKHCPVIIEPRHLKMLVEVLSENLEEIEDDHGEIALPEDWKMDDSTEQEIEDPDEMAEKKYIG